MVAPAKLRRRWFVSYTTGEPQPLDGFYGSEKDAKVAKKIMVECYQLPAEKLVIHHEDVPVDRNDVADEPTIADTLKAYGATDEGQR